eukprot:834045-Pelagomonas_calceolata.AAC.1
MDPQTMPAKAAFQSSTGIMCLCIPPYNPLSDQSKGQSKGQYCTYMLQVPNTLLLGNVECVAFMSGSSQPANHGLPLSSVYPPSQIQKVSQFYTSSPHKV